LVLFRPSGKIHHPELNGIEYEIFITGPHPRSDAVIERRPVKRSFLRCQQGNISKSKRGELEAQHLIIDIKAGLRVKGGPLGAIDGIAAEITQTEYIIKGKRIDALPVELPRIADIYILTDL